MRQILLSSVIIVDIFLWFLDLLQYKNHKHYSRKNDCYLYIFGYASNNKFSLNNLRYSSILFLLLVEILLINKRSSCFDKSSLE